MQYWLLPILGLVVVLIPCITGFDVSNCVSLVATHGALSIMFSHDNPDNYGTIDYTDNYEKCWTISTVDSEHIKVTAVGFVLQSNSGSGCVDYIEIYNGATNTSELVGQYCGTSFNTYTSTGTNIILRFVTDASITAAGFRIEATGENNSDTTSVNVGQVVGFTLLTIAIIALGVVMMIFCVTSHYNKQRHPHMHHNHPEDIAKSRHPISRPASAAHHHGHSNHGHST